MPESNGWFRMTNDMAEKLAKLRIPGEAWQVLWVIIRKIEGWQGKTSDHISFSQFKELTGIKNDGNIGRSLTKLLEMNIINRETEGIYSFNKDHSKWVPLVKKQVLANSQALVKKQAVHLSKSKQSTCQKASKPLANSQDTIDSIDIYKDTTKDILRSKKKRPPKGNPDHPIAVKYFYDQYQLQFSQKYNFNGKDAKLIKSLLSTFGLETLKDLIDEIIHTDDDWIKQAGISIPILSHQANKLAQAIVGRREGGISKIGGARGAAGKYDRFG